MKVCNTCNKNLPDDHYWSAGIKNGKKHYRKKCKTCYGKVKNYLRYRNKDWLIKYKEKLACQKCGYSKKTHPSFSIRALEFHHREDNKEFAVSNGVHSGVSIQRLKDEIDKCDVLCARCHMELHAEES